MYKVTITNNGVDTLINYPTANPNVPHLTKLELNQKRNQAGSLTFDILMNNPGYSLLVKFVTKITVIDTRDNKEKFAGRVYSIKPSMDNNGQFMKEVICEGEMNYLQDTVVESDIYEDKTPQDIITEFLKSHNAAVEDYKRIQPGNINVPDYLFFTSDFETTLEAINKYAFDEDKGCLKLRKENGIKYLDYVSSDGGQNVVNITLGVNLQEMAINDDQDFGTRIVPVGANGLSIENVNDNKNYIEDSAAVAKYGIIYKKVEYKDIDDDSELKKQCQADLSQYISPQYTFEITALDLSVLAKTSIDQIDINTTVHINNPKMGTDDNYKVYELDVDLLKPWNPKLTISNKPLKLSTSIVDLKTSSVQNDGDYSGVQVGDSYGVRAVSKDSNATITINGKDGIVIKNSSKKVFYVDTNGNIVANDGTYNDITANNMTANKGTFNDITANNGIYNSITTNDMVANEMKTSNTTNYMIMHDQYIDFYHSGALRMRVGFDGSNNFPTVSFYGESGLGGGVVGIISAGSTGLSITGGDIDITGNAFLNNSGIATEEWVKQYVSSQTPSSGGTTSS